MTSHWPCAVAAQVQKYAEGLMARWKTCKSCKLEYLAVRRDQKYCSPGCARPAKKAAKLKWWRNNRAVRGKE